ncbi:MAG: aldehyde ferredoxin oxidoreductase family protein [Thermoplasmata archaeon]
MKGVNGKILEIDLTEQKVNVIKLGEEIYRKFLGGYGLGAWYLYTHMKKNVDPYSSDNILGIIPGMLNVTNYPMSGRFMGVSKSPLSNLYTDSNSGGHFGPKLMMSGYDGIFIKGISEKRAYAVIDHDEIYIEKAEDLWGKDTKETEKILKNKYSNSEIISIGKTGERKSPISCIITDFGRALGRTGLGGVMGSKNLKAIVAKGNEKPDLYDPEWVRRIIKGFSNAYKNEKFVYWHKYGTSNSTVRSTLNGDAPIKNWKGVASDEMKIEYIENLKGDEVIKDNVKSYACASCPVACGAIIRRNTRYGFVEGHRVEYEGASLFGTSLLNTDLDSIVYSFELCNRHGLDVISTAAIIGFMMEAYEKGIVTKDQLGFELKWGDPDAIVKSVELIANGEGLGKYMEQGVKKLSEVINKNSESFAIHVHGVELPAHDPRFMPSVGITYIADPTPGRHTAGGLGFFEDTLPQPPFDTGFNFEFIKRYEYKGKGKYHAIMSNAEQVQNALGFCRFRRIVPEYAIMPYPEMIEAATGLKFTKEELYRTGERIQNMRMIFNVREGWVYSENRIPEIVKGTPPLKSGPLKDVTVDLELMVREYFEAMGWDPVTGKPSDTKLKELGIYDIYEKYNE